MKKVTPLTCAVIIALLLAACIHDDNADCQFGYKVEVSVLDKNYDNIGQFSLLTPKDENQPFSHFSGTIHYVLTNEKTGQITHESEVISITPSAMTYSLAFDNLPTGEYHLAVWGNLTTDVPAGILHPDGKEHADVYVASTRFNITNKDGSTQLQLKRTKGELIVFCSNIPTNIVRMQQTLTNVYAQADATLNYSQPITLKKEVNLQEVNSLYAAPTPPGMTSQLSLSFYTANNSTPILTIPDVTQNISRNQISAVTVDYDSVNRLWNIWTYIDGEWMLLHHLTIE